jgi:RimJ/RimL family protein N-acetyltransferase
VSWTIRRLTGNDGALFREIRLEALQRHPEAFGSDFADEAVHDADWFAARIGRSAVFGAFTGSDFIGTSSFYAETGRKSAHIGRLVSMYVRPEGRGTGMALALVETVLQHASMQVMQVELGVAVDNEPAIRLYKKAGFETYGTEPNALFVNGRYIDEHLMVRFVEGTRKAD